jgi:hypothetical protein
MPATRPMTVSELHGVLDGARAVITGLLRHSCVADTPPEDKNIEDCEVESEARRLLRLLDDVIDPDHITKLN